jgi:uncharacterized protein YkwD
MVRRLLLLVVAVVLAVSLAACRSPGQTAVADALNADRVANQLSVLAPSDMLDVKAQAWANQLAQDGYLHHSNLTTGVTGCWRALGENVGYGASVATIEAAYMASAPHRANILNGSYNLLGAGMATDGQGRVWTVQEFEQGC